LIKINALTTNTKRQKTTQKWNPQGALSKMELAIWDLGIDI
jgi:hypothetical protein